MVQAINQHFNIQEKDQTVLPILLARLEAKDLEPDYFAGELSEELKFERDKALGISAEIKRTVLGPIKKELSDIGVDISLLDKFQIPAIKGLSPSVVAAAAAPKMIQDVGPAASMPAAPAAPKPSTVSDIGWSKKPAPPAVPIAPTIRPDALQVSWIVPTPTPKPISSDAAAAAAAQPAEPAPVMLHQDTTFKAPEKNAGFTLTRPGSGAEVSLSQSGAGGQAPTRPAVLEFGGSNAPAKPAAPAAGAVHYTEFAAGARNVSQVSPPSPSASPVPVPVPRPPQPPQMPQSPQQDPQQKQKTIVKDFL